MAKKYKKIGKCEGKFCSQNDFWIKKFERGVKLRKKGQGEITLSVDNVFEMNLYLRKYCKRDAFPILLTAIDLIYVWQKYPKTQEFIERLLLDEVSDLEKLKIQKEYMTKVNILKELE